MLCKAGLLTALYTAFSTSNRTPAATQYAYLSLYILAYIADDALMVGLAIRALLSNLRGKTRWEKTEASQRSCGDDAGCPAFAPGWLL